MQSKMECWHICRLHLLPQSFNYCFFPIPAFTDFVSSITGLEAAVWQGKLALVNDASLGIGGLLVLLSISRSLADKLGINGIQVTMTSVVAFMLLVPFGANDTGNFISVTYLGAQTIFYLLLFQSFQLKFINLLMIKELKLKCLQRCHRQ